MFMRTKGENDETLCCLQAYNVRTGQGLAVALPGKETTEYAVRAVESYLK